MTTYEVGKGRQYRTIQVVCYEPVSRWARFQARLARIWYVVKRFFGVHPKIYVYPDMPWAAGVEIIDCCTGFHNDPITADEYLIDSEEK